MTLEFWFSAKARLNHDILKNRLSLEISTATKIAEGRVVDPRFTSRFLITVETEFPRILDDIDRLLASYVQSASPQRLFEEAPLCNSDEEFKSWLSALVHELWIRNCRVAERLSNSQQVLVELQAIQRDLLLEIKKADDKIVRNQLPLLHALQGSVARLTSDLSAYSRSFWCFPKN